MTMPKTRVDYKQVVLGGGLDLLSTSQMAKQGSAVYAHNYEPAFGGGWERVGGIEKFSGQPSPAAANYTLLSVEAGINGAFLGDTITGKSSGATGIAVYLTETRVAMTKVAGTFALGEELQTFGVTRGVNSGGGSAVSAQLDNTLHALAAAVYASDIAAVPGSGPIRGVSSLGATVYAWRDNADATAMGLYKATPAGWVAVEFLYELSFTLGGGVQPDEGSTITQGSVTATLKRVALESGTYASTSAAGRYIISAPAGGSFVAGALAGTLGTVPTAGDGVYIGAQTTLAPGGRVLTDRFNFTASADTMRLYGCDGVNREFEFDGEVYVPLTSGQPTKATVVKCHANHLFFGFRGSLQHSGILAQYTFTSISGGAELGTGDVITGLVTLPGDSERAAMLVTCQDSARVLYGNAASGDYAWTFIPISSDAGANAFSIQDCGVPLFHDTPGFRAFKSAQQFGNFTWNIESRMIDPAVKEKTPIASCFSKAQTRYRCFFSDGSIISGTPGSKGWEWGRISYNRSIVIAHSDEIAGVTRTFYGDADGYVYEADIGRSFNGEPITGIVHLHGLNQNAPGIEKTYRFLIVETIAEGAFTLQSRAEFNDGSPGLDATTMLDTESVSGNALWDVGMWDQSFWDTRRQDSKRLDHTGYGYNVSPIFSTSSNEELPHTIKTVTVYYTARKVRAS